MANFPWREPFAYDEDHQDTFINHVDIDFLNDSLPEPTQDQLSKPGYSQPWHEDDFLDVLQEVDDHLGDTDIHTQPMPTTLKSSTTYSKPASLAWHPEEPSVSTTSYFKVHRPVHNPSSLKASPPPAAAQALTTARSLARQQTLASPREIAVTAIAAHSPDESLLRASDDDADSVDHVHCKHRNLYQDRLDYRHRGRPVKPRKLSPKSWPPPRSRFDKRALPNVPCFL